MRIIHLGSTSPEMGASTGMRTNAGRSTNAARVTSTGRGTTTGRSTNAGTGINVVRSSIAGMSTVNVRGTITWKSFCLWCTSGEV